MSAPKYTPGPWLVAPRHGPTVHVTGQRKMSNGKVFTSPPGNVVAFVHDDTDAALIAAAPELLQALRDLSLQIASLRREGDRPNPAHDRARALLARVDGSGK